MNHYITISLYPGTVRKATTFHICPCSNPHTSLHGNHDSSYEYESVASRNMSPHTGNQLFYSTNLFCQVTCFPKEWDIFFFFQDNNTPLYSALLQSLIIRSWWAGAIYSLFHWQRTSPVGIVCRSWCYIRKKKRKEMKEFGVCYISPCIRLPRLFTEH